MFGISGGLTPGSWLLAPGSWLLVPGSWKLLAPGPVLTLAKGFANPAGELLSQGLQPPGGLGVLSGPSFAQDLFHDRPTALTLAVTAAAGTAATPSTPLLEWLSTPSLRLYASQDPVGVQVCGAMKNIIAIACGCAEGMGLGASARTALMTRGLREIERVILAYGGDPKTAAGLAGAFAAANALTVRWPLADLKSCLNGTSGTCDSCLQDLRIL